MICWTNVGIKAYIEERMKELEKKIAKQYKVMQVFTSILRQELTEEVVELNSSELMKRYLTVKQSEKLELELRKLREQLDSGVEGAMNVNIINAWEEIPNDDD